MAFFNWGLFYTKLAYLVVDKTCYIRLSIPVFGKTGSRKKEYLLLYQPTIFSRSIRCPLVRDVIENKPPYD
jgi:hypothetical protein